jgi:hypothetical protein
VLTEVGSGRLAACFKPFVDAWGRDDAYGRPPPAMSRSTAGAA